jgi:hypothetical protein
MRKRGLIRKGVAPRRLRKLDSFWEVMKVPCIATPSFSWSLGGVLMQCYAVMQPKIRTCSILGCLSSPRCLFDYQESFLSEIPSPLSASYGVTQVIVSKMNTPEISNSENTVDFGQIVPLFLLILPILAVAEVYYQPQESHSG